METLTVMKEVDLGHIKKSHRFRDGVDQILRLYNKKQKQMIIEAIKNRPDDWTIEDALRVYELSPAVYYSWIRREKKRKMDNLINNVREETPAGKKRWIIEITAENEERAERYLRMLHECFEVAVKHELPMDAATMSDPDRGEILTCKKM
jgi:hypothetical protein